MPNFKIFEQLFKVVQKEVYNKLFYILQLFIFFYNSVIFHNNLNTSIKENFLIAINLFSYLDTKLFEHKFEFDTSKKLDLQVLIDLN